MNLPNSFENCYNFKADLNLVNYSKVCTHFSLGLPSEKEAFLVLTETHNLLKPNSTLETCVKLWVQSINVYTCDTKE